MENPAPMVNDNIAKWIKACDKLLTKAKKSRTDHVTNLIRQTNQACFKSKVSENRQDSRKLWNLIKFLSGSDNHNCGLQQLVDNDGTISNKVEIAKTLNSFFLNLQNNFNPQSELKNDLHCQCNGCHAFATGHWFVISLFRVKRVKLQYDIIVCPSGTWSLSSTQNRTLVSYLVLG